MAQTLRADDALDIVSRTLLHCCQMMALALIMTWTLWADDGLDAACFGLV